MYFPGVPITHLRLERSSPARPEIPIASRNLGPDVFVPSSDWADWIVATFVHRDGAFHNPDHQHLEFAHIGVLWTNATNHRKMRTTLAEAEIPNPRGGPWQIARQKYQLSEWFGDVPDFLITFSGEHLGEASDRKLCAIIEHELTHCAHALNQYGAPRFHRDGTPIFGIRGHDCEEFAGVVERWGPSADVQRLIDAAKNAPVFDDEEIEWACGTCQRMAA